MVKSRERAEEPKQSKNSPGDPLRSIRRSFIVLERVTLDSLKLNDDSLERSRVRLETPASSPATSTSSRRSLNLSSISKFTVPEMAAGIAECIKLNTENKITKKNAFKLKLIDFMTYCVKHREENMSNLQLASTTLDVSAKIYGLRVDVLHQDTLDIIGNLDHEIRHGAVDAAIDHNEASADHNHSRVKPKKKKKATKVLTDLESLCCDPEIIKLEPPMLGDEDSQTSYTLLQATAPRHVGLGLAIHPYNDQILDKRAPETGENSGKIPWSSIKASGDIGDIFKEFKFLDFDSEDVSENSAVNGAQQNASVLEEDHCRYDLNGSYTEDDDSQVHHDFEDPGDMSEHEGRYGNQRGRQSLADVQDIIDHAPEANDYSFFEARLSVESRWKSPNQSIVKTRVKRAAKNSVDVHRRKKEEMILDFEEDIDEELESKYDAMKKAAKKKPKAEDDVVTKPDASDQDHLVLFKFATRKHDEDLMPEVRKVHQRESGEHEEDSRVNFESFDESRDCDDEGGDLGDHDMSDDQGNDLPRSDAPGNDGDDHGGFGTQGFTGDNLVEAVKLTKKIDISFSRRAKKFNMRELKKCLWRSINDGVDGTESGVNEKGNRVKGLAKIYEDLPGKLNKNDAKELSFPIAFVSLLHLANEKNLELEFDEALVDIVVTQEAGR